MAKEKEKVMKHLGEEKSSKGKGGKKIHTHEIRVKRADHGGHHIEHHMRDEDGNDAGIQTGVAANNDEMAQHVQDAMGDQPPAGEGAPPQQAPDPSAGGGGMMPGGMGQ